METQRYAKISFKEGRQEYAEKRGGYVVTKDMKSVFPIGSVVIPHGDGYTNEVLKSGSFYRGQFWLEIL